jgi:general secretion pathway protein J
MKKLTRGYTLIELIIALFIFSIIAMLITFALRAVIKARDNTITANQRLEEIQACITRLDADIQQMTPYIRHDAAGLPLSTLLWENQVMTFTRSGFINPQSQLPRSNLAMIRYELKGTDLLRYTDTLPYKTLTTDPQILLKGVRSWQWNFFDAQQKSYTNWPPVQSLSIVTPSALHLSLQLNDYGAIERFWLTPEQHFVYQAR